LHEEHDPEQMRVVGLEHHDRHEYRYRDVCHAATSPEIKKRKNEHPHQIDEVLVEAGDFDDLVMPSSAREKAVPLDIEVAPKTKKRQTPAPIPPRLLAHLRRWKDRKLIATCFVEFNGKPVVSGKKGFSRAVGLAGLALQLPFCFEVRAPSDRLVSSAPK
jgi:hypothetical protein